MPLPKLNRGNLPAYTDPVPNLSADTPRKFGTMTPAAMLSHLTHTLEVSCGAAEDPDHSNWFTRGPGRVLAFHWFTRWPGGVIKQPDSWSPPPSEEFEGERQKFLAALDRFCDALEATPDRLTVSPLLGPRSIAYWSHLHSVHFAHHYRQFGLR